MNAADDESSKYIEKKWTVQNPRVKVTGFAVLAIMSRVVFFVVTPLWLDFFHSKNSTAAGNLTKEFSSPAVSIEYHFEMTAELTSDGNATLPVCMHTPIPFFTVLGQWAFSFVAFGLLSLLMLIFRPEMIRNPVERSYPMRNLVIIGTSQGLSSILMAYSISGSRTPPYLQAILINFVIPIQFTVRFIVLRKRPTLLKAICAAVVALCEFVCLIPTIFPSLENEDQHRQEGGSSGPDRFLWPIFFVGSSIPFALSNSIMERGVQKSSPASGDQSPGAINTGSPNVDDQSQSGDRVSTTASAPLQMKQLNLVYFNFWCCFYVTLTLMLLFWFDILPVVGTSHSIAEFGCQMWFNLRCIFGGAGCSAVVSVLGWLDFASVFIANVAFAGLMRYSEGANFVMVLMTIRTPIIFLFWTLFVEQPFSWQPHVGLSTWLSIGSIVVMVAAIVLYDRAPTEVDTRASKRRDLVEDERQLLADPHSTNDLS